MRFSLVALCFGMAGLMWAPLSAHAAQKLEVSGWIPYWRVATGTADTLSHLDAFTEINPFGYVVKTDGTLYDAAGLSQEPWTSLIAAAKTKKIRVIPTVMWGDTDAIHRILSHTTARIALEKEIASTTIQNGFDGVDIDFEAKKAKDKNYFSIFLKGLYARMGNKWVMCSIEPRVPVVDRYDGTPPPDATTYANDYVAINRYCDRVRIMAYDQGTVDLKLNEAQAAPYVPVADVLWVERVVKLAAKTISKRKLEIGVATYGYEYQVTPLSEQGYRYDLLWAFNPKYALDLANQYHLTPLRNSAGELSFLYIPGSAAFDATDTPMSNLGAPASTSYSGNPPAHIASSTPQLNIAWWSDAQAIADKIALAKKLGVRGIAIFKIDGGEDPALWSVLAAQTK